MIKMRVSAFALGMSLISSLAFADGGFITMAANQLTIAAPSDGTVLIYIGANGPIFFGGAQGDFVVPPSVNENARSRMLAVALQAKATQWPTSEYLVGRNLF